MDDLFEDLALWLADLAPEAREKVEALKNFRSDLEAVNTQMLMTLVNNLGGPEPETLEHLDSLYEQIGKDLQNLRVKLFDKKEGA